MKTSLGMIVSGFRINELPARFFMNEILDMD
jgi:hypothetical protein